MTEPGVDRVGAAHAWGDGRRSPWAGAETVHPVRERGVIILEPTPAQIARGERVLWIESSSQRTAMSMLRWGRANGWTGGLTRSRYLSEPPTGGDVSRRGRRLETETVALRLTKGITLIYLRWDFDVERSTWKPDGGLTAQREGAGWGGLRVISITAARVIMGMQEEEATT